MTNIRRTDPKQVCLYIELVVVLLAIAIIMGIYSHNSWSLPVLARWQIGFTASFAFILDYAIGKVGQKMRK